MFRISRLKKMGFICYGILFWLPFASGVLSAYGVSYAVSSECSGKIYYVAPYGSDENPGTLDRPWRTIQKAADTLTAGDIVYIREGLYRERLLPKNSGRDGCFIIYSAYPGEKVIIDGSGITLPDDLVGLVEISGKNYIEIAGMDVLNAGPNDNNAGILVKDSTYIIIRDNYIENTTSSGIGVWNSRHVIVEGNEVTLCCNDGEQECITIAGTGDFEVRSNHVHHGGPGTKGGEGIDIKDGSERGRVYRNHVHHLNNRSGIYVDAWDKNTGDIDVFQNVVHDIRGNDGIGVGSEEGGLLNGVRIYNNIVYNNGLSGIVLSDAGSASEHPVRNVKIVNNTLYGNGTAGSWGGGISVENPDVEDLLIRNNICSQNAVFQIQIEVPVINLSVDHNLIDGYREYDDEIKGNNVVEGSAGFVNADVGDFHLGTNSLAIDAGTPEEAPTIDFEDKLRPFGSGYDIGAYEYHPNQMNSEYVNYIQKCYIGLYGRPADPEGLDYWVDRLEDAGGDVRTIIDAFGNSEEFFARYGNLSNSELIDKIYQQLFNRLPDPDGKNYYMDLISRGEMTLPVLVVTVLDAARGSDREIISNKLSAAQYFTDLVRRGCIFRNRHISYLAAIISQIGSSSSSLDNAIESLDSFCGF